MDRVVIIGGKGTAVNIAEQILQSRSQYGTPFELLGFALDDPDLGDSINGFPVLCKTRDVLAKFTSMDVKFLFSLYKPAQMKERVALLKSYAIPRDRFLTFVHPLAYVAPSAQLGVGNVVLANSTIQSNVTVGDHNVINSQVLIEHNATLHDSNFIAGAVTIGSAVKIGIGNFIGLNASVREGVCIRDYTFIGMASNVLRDVQTDATVFGNPARLRQH